jgi:hypothetical protein
MSTILDALNIFNGTARKAQNQPMIPITAQTSAKTKNNALKNICDLSPPTSHKPKKIQPRRQHEYEKQPKPKPKAK